MQTVLFEDDCHQSRPFNHGAKGKSRGGPFVGEDRRGAHAPANKASDVAILRVKTHYRKLPQIESRYTRSDSRRCYLDNKLSINKIN